MARPHAPTGISRESLRQAIDQALMLGLERSAYEAWTECTVRDPMGHSFAEPQLVPASRLSYQGLSLLTRTPLATGTRLLLRLIAPNATSGPDQCAVVRAIEPGDDSRWWRCVVRFVHPEDREE